MTIIPETRVDLGQTAKHSMETATIVASAAIVIAIAANNQGGNNSQNQNFDRCSSSQGGDSGNTSKISIVVKSRLMYTCPLCIVAKHPTILLLDSKP